MAIDPVGALMCGKSVCRGGGEGKRKAREIGMSAMDGTQTHGQASRYGGKSLIVIGTPNISRGRGRV